MVCVGSVGKASDLAWAVWVVHPRVEGERREQPSARGRVGLVPELEAALGVPVGPRFGPDVDCHKARPAGRERRVGDKRLHWDRIPRGLVRDGAPVLEGDVVAVDDLQVRLKGGRKVNVRVAVWGPEADKRGA